MLKFGCIILLCLVFGSSIHAEDAQPRLTSAALQQWLRSGDPRLIAWAAHYVGQYGEAGYPGTLAAMAEVLDKERTTLDWNALAPAASQHDHDEAVTAILDAFIQQKSPPSTETVAWVAGRFPQQSVLLASYLPESKKRSLLDIWYELRNGDYSGGFLARLATLMLADNPPPALAASLINEAEEQLTIIVLGKPRHESGLGSGTCGDSMSTAVRTNWPIVYTYQFEENATSTHDPLLVAVDDDRISYRP